MTNIGINIHVTGIVQGVGFRPFIYNLAKEHQLNGWVRNTSAGVDIYIEGQQTPVDNFISTLKNHPPPLSKIENIIITNCQPLGIIDFQIIQSEPIPNAFQPISPDICICKDCLQELFNPIDRRYLYPFINCTNCGPRYTIIKDIPYDRPFTTMSGFSMCTACQNEYKNPQDRRFHAQPIACPDCGPQVWLESQDHTTLAHEASAIQIAREMLINGKILAIKGLGGFHLACDATNRLAVQELRRRKLRVDKPFALMLPDMNLVEKNCVVDEYDHTLLTSHQRPIVILPRRPVSKIAYEVAPEQNTIGVMLPYTPLHYLLFANKNTHFENLLFDELCLVMTSGNQSEEPIATENEDARLRLSNLADAFLLHDRPIRVRCDDSVVCALPTHNLFAIRRSRSYSPSPIQLPFSSPPLLATGSELKNTFCLARDMHAFPSHHIGDMENFETYQAFVDGIDHMQLLFRIQPSLIACDLHPDYLATRFAIERANKDNLGLTYVQHHHAHIASCMAENGIVGDEPVIGIALDGTGYGSDGAIWGGEFLVSDYRGFTRAFHLKYLPLPGGDKSIRRPARIALAYLWRSDLNWDEELPCVKALHSNELNILKSQLEHGINTHFTSSMGRLFDAIASIIGIRQSVNYEAQAAIELEAVVNLSERGRYSFDIIPGVNHSPGLIDPKSMIETICQETKSGVPKDIIAARFHNTIVNMITCAALSVRSQTGINKIVLSGGVWQNRILLTRSVDMLKKEHFIVYTHKQVPTNDGGISLGQAAIAGFQSAN